MEKFNHGLIPENVERETVDNKREFRDHFAELEYKEQESMPLNPPENDKTVAFVGSSINAFKAYLEKGVSPEESFFILQPCIRTHDIVNAYDITNIPFGMPFFHIYGTFSPAGTYSKTAADVISFLIEGCKISSDDILIKPTIPEMSDDLLRPFVEIGAQVEVDESRYYEWRYGIDDVRGRGVTIFVRHKDGEWWDVGNVVSISNQDDKEIAVEFGVGSEFLQTAICGYDDPFEASGMSKIIAPESPVHKKTLTYLEVALNASSTIKGGVGRTKKMTNKYINVVHYLCQVSGYSREDLVEIASSYKQISDVDIDVEGFLEKYDSRTEVFDTLDSVFTNITNNNLDYDEAISNLDDYLGKNGIRKEELMIYVEEKYGDNIKIKDLCEKI